MFYLSNKKSETPTPITLRRYFAAEKKTLKYSTNLKIHPSDWDSNTNMPRKKRGNSSDAMHRAITKSLLHYKATIEDILAESTEIRKRLTMEEFKEQLDMRVKGKHKIEKLSFFDAFDKFIREKEIQKLSNNTVKAYRQCSNIFLDFQKERKRRISFNSLTDDFYFEFLDYNWTVRGNHDNSIGRMIGRLRSFMLWSEEKGYHDTKAYRKYKKISYETDHVALSEEDLEKLESVELIPRLDRVRDLFLIGCYSGQRISDYSVFDEADIENGMIVKRAKKTDKKSYIPLHDKLKALLEKHDYNLPTISEQRFNDYIKEACQIAGINERTKKTMKQGSQKTVEVLEKWQVITSHTARRTFITFALRKGMQPKIVMQITGINKIETLNRYNKINEDDVKGAMVELWS